MTDQTDIARLTADWDDRYRDAQSDAPTAAMVLRDNLHLLPAQGQALDLACGRGGNALLLAQRGLQVDAWDLSPVAITQLQASAVQRQLDIVAAVRDVVAWPPSAMGYDVVVVSYFLERALAPALMAALRPGGLLFYQTFGPDRFDDRGPRNPDYRLEAGELLRSFVGLTPCLYREESLFGDLQQGLRGEVMFIGARPPL